MIIRHANENDLPAIVAIYNASIPGRMATADLEPVTVMSRINWFNNRSPVKHPLWVLETGGVIAGWLSFQPFYGRQAYHATAEVSIYIATKYHRQGLGKRLLKEAIRQSPNLGLTTLMGFIFGHNEASLKLFEQFGFERWGNMPKIAELDGVERDLVILGLRVG